MGLDQLTAIYTVCTGKLSPHTYTYSQLGDVAIKLISRTSDILNIVRRLRKVVSDYTKCQLKICVSKLSQ